MASQAPAFVFDLDGTIVQTESLKADSYHRVLERLDPSITRARAHHAYAEVVGRSGEEVVKFMVDHFALADGFADQLGPEPEEARWATLYRVRRAAYAAILEDPDALREAACPYAREVLEWARGEGYPVALATMSHRPQVRHVLAVLGLDDTFDQVCTRDDVNEGKPNPEIYLKVFERLEVAPHQTLIFEDSPSGARAAIDSGGRVVVVVNDVTRRAVRAAQLDREVAAVAESDRTLLPRVRALIEP